MPQENFESAIFSDWTPKWMQKLENEGSTQEGPDEFKEALRREATPDFVEAMREVEAAHVGIFDEGVKSAHNKIEALRKTYRNTQDEAAENRRFEAEYKKFGPEVAEALANDRAEQGSLKHFEYPAPVWQQTTGLFPQWEKKMNVNERAGRIAKLLRMVERLVKYEMKNEKGKIKNEQQQNIDPQSDDDSSVVRETYLWDPLRTVCFKLEISLAHLSRYSKETTGMSATEMVDCIRMQRARKRMKRELAAFILNLRTQTRLQHGGTENKAEGTENDLLKIENCKMKISNCDEPHTANLQSEICNPKLDANAIWEELKKVRLAPRWHRTSWAASLGFSSYGKFFRASILVFGVTPHELEIALIDEILAEDAHQNRDRQGAQETLGAESGKQKPEDGAVEVVKRE